MNNAELNRLLKSAKTPARAGSHWEGFPSRVLAEMRRGIGTQERRVLDCGGKRSATPLWQRLSPFPKAVSPLRSATALQRPGNGPREPWFPRLAWGLAAATACLVIGFAVGNWRGQTNTASNGLLQNGKVIREMMAMFPNRIRAIVQNERGLSLVLSEKADVPDSPPLLVQVVESGRRSSYVTFSGQEIEIAGEKVSVLSDAKGSVMLVGDRFFWSGAERAGVGDNLKIQVRTLVL